MYDVILIGTGGIGSATLYELVRRGARVLGIDRFQVGHDRGSSHGETRIIRRSYYEHVDYVPLLNLAYRLWDEFSETTGIALLQRTGLIYVGPTADPALKGVVSSAKTHRIDVQPLSAQESADRFPGFVVPPGETVLLEPDAGYLQLEPAITTFVSEAVRLGADVHQGMEVVGWSASDRRVVVETTAGRFEADKLVITAGCWARSLLADLNIPLQVVRKHLHWFAPADNRYAQDLGCPCFLYAVSGRYFYGFPDHGQGVKVAEHSGGMPIDNPLADDRSPEPDDTRRIQDFLVRHLPGVTTNQLRHEVCFYTLTPDGHFVIDHHPEHDNVVFAAGLSGHGFKFAPALGRTLSELALDRQCHINVEFLSARRRPLQP